MNDTVGAVLKDVLTRHTRAVLDNPRQFENILGEKPLAKREAAALIATLKERIPQRLLSMPAAGLTTAMVLNFAAQISNEVGLRDDVARWAVETWVSALGLGIAVKA